VKLTSTNRSIGLIALIVSAHLSLPYRALRCLRALDGCAEDQIRRCPSLAW
jgi:hypothetical protein